MFMPAEAFAERVPQDLAPGSIFRFREAWAFFVSHEHSEGAPVPSFIMLQGERVGTLFKGVEAMQGCLTLAEPFAWFPAIPAGVMPTRDVFETASLSVTASGPILIGGMPERWGGPDKFAFGINGKCLGEAPRGAVNRYAKWTAELCHPSRPFVSLGRIFAVDRSRE